VHGGAGLDPAAVLAALDGARPLADLEDVEHHDDVHEGLRAARAEIFVDVSASPSDGAEPAIALMREALDRGSAVVTSNKWPVALSGRELADLAASARLPFRAESTVMSGTPVLGPLTEGLAGATPTELRGVLNATANFILCEVESGRGYDEALSDAQRRGLAERNPSADVDGHDATAKLMILAALVLGRGLQLDDVERVGISAIDAEAVAAARADGLRTRELATLALDGDTVQGRVEPVTLRPDDPLAAIEGTDNAVVCEAEPIGRVTITGPGAGPRLAGQGVFSDLINAARQLVAAGGRRAG
jgi:homoserine dehydrogenase